VVRGTDALAGMVGLSFTPRAGRRVPGIAGTVWLDRSDGVLRLLEFRYVNVRDAPAAEPAHGRIEFERLPTGIVAVSRWWIRTPLLGERRVQLRQRTAMRTEVVAFQETGGELARAEMGGTTFELGMRGRLAGRVVRAATGEPVPGARIVVEGTSHTVATAADGSFSLSEVRPGLYRMAVRHPSVDSLPGAPPATEVTILPNETADVTLTIPSRTELLGGLCPDRRSDFTLTAVYGVLRDSRNRDPLAGWSVALQWDAFEGAPDRTLYVTGTAAEITTDEAGRFLLCNVPAERAIVLVATSSAGERHRIPLRAAPRLSYHEIELERQSR
jgi:hypothetical protein